MSILLTSNWVPLDYIKNVLSCGNTSTATALSDSEEGTKNP